MRKISLTLRRRGGGQCSKVYEAQKMQEGQFGPTILWQRLPQPGGVPLPGVALPGIAEVPGPGRV